MEPEFIMKVAQRELESLKGQIGLRRNKVKYTYIVLISNGKTIKLVRQYIKTSILKSKRQIIIIHTIVYIYYPYPFLNQRLS